MRAPKLTTWRGRAAASAALSLAALTLTGTMAASAGTSAGTSAAGSDHAKATSVVHDVRGAHAAGHPQTGQALLSFSSVHVCTKYANGSGNILCVATTDLNDGTPVKGNTSSNFRDINAVYQFDAGGLHVYRLKFSGDTARCIGISSSDLSDIRDCSGGNSNNTNWRAAISCSGSCVRWENNTLLGDYLASDSVGGDQLYASSCGGIGELCAWTPTP